MDEARKSLVAPDNTVTTGDWVKIVTPETSPVAINSPSPVTAGAAGDHYVRMEDTKEAEEKKPSKKLTRQKSASEEQDVVMPVSMTILCKCIEDDDGKLLLIGTMIYRIINPPPELERLQLRINDMPPPEGCIEERRGRPVEFENLEELEGNPLPNVPAGQEVKGLCVTSQIKLPLKVDPEEGISYPFKIVKAKVKIEFSSPAINGIQYRPSIMEVNGDENFREFICLKHHKKEGAKKDDPPEKSYDQDGFDQTAEYDTINPVPDVTIDPEIKGKTMYFPKFDLEWQLTAPFLKPMIGTMLPILLLLVLQWINWMLELIGEGADKNAYLTNSITIILALVVLVPTIGGHSAGTRSTITSIEYMVFFFFLGTGLSSIPEFWPAFIGLVITTASMIFPLVGVGKYNRRIYSIQHDKIPVKHLLPLPGSKARGELIDFKRVKARPAVAPKKKDD